MAASDTQVGGSHYKDMGDFQPWDVLKHWLTPEEYRGYQKGVAIAYLARERSKGGGQDIAKATHHLQKLVEVMGEQALAAQPADDLHPFKVWSGGRSGLPAGVFLSTLVDVVIDGDDTHAIRGPAESFNWCESDVPRVTAWRCV